VPPLAGLVGGVAGALEAAVAAAAAAAGAGAAEEPLVAAGERVAAVVAAPDRFFW